MFKHSTLLYPTFLSIFILITTSFLNLHADEKALHAFKNKEYQKAFSLYMIDAKNGNSTAQSALSYLYFNGYGIQKDTDKGILWLKKSAHNMNSKAQYDLAMIYVLGQNTKINKSLAFSWLDSASDLGNKDAQYNLALMYYQGDSIKIDVKKSAELLESAAIKGHKGAIENIGLIYMQLIQFDKAEKWLKINANNGNTNSYYLLSEVYCNQEKYAQAKKWARKSLDAGHVEAEALWKKYNLEKY